MFGAPHFLATSENGLERVKRLFLLYRDGCYKTSSLLSQNFRDVEHTNCGDSILVMKSGDSLWHILCTCVCSEKIMTKDCPQFNVSLLRHC
jgi:hypothetical protein